MDQQFYGRKLLSDVKKPVITAGSADMTKRSISGRC